MRRRCKIRLCPILPEKMGSVRIKRSLPLIFHLSMKRICAAHGITNQWTSARCTLHLEHCSLQLLIADCSLHITIARCTPLIADCSVLNEMGTWAAVGSYESIAPLGQVLLPPRAPGSIPPTNQRPTYDQRRPSAGRNPPYITICLSYISIPLPTPPKTTHQTVTKYKVGNDLKDLLDGWRIPLTYRFFQDFLSGRACKAIFLTACPNWLRLITFTECRQPYDLGKPKNYSG